MTNTEGRTHGNAADLTRADLSGDSGRRRPGRRPLKLRPYEPSEFDVHVQLAEVLRKWGHPRCLWTTIPNQQDSGPARGAHLKRMGVRAGAGDMLFVHEGATLFLELKRRAGVMSDSQNAFAELAMLAGAEYRVASSLPEAIAILRGRGIITRDLAT